jgi:diguanylate cyclase (GGDEF)-like protein/PAS domain S-box-containing protein
MVGERKRPDAEGNLSKAEETRSILDTAHEAFVSMDSGGFITDWNPQAELTFGWSRQEAIGKVLADLVIPERYREQHWKGLQRFMETGEGPVLNERIEIEALHRGGYEFPIELTISVQPEANAPYFNAFLHDITERRRTAQYVDAQLTVTRVLAEAKSEDDLIAALLSRLGEAMTWDFGGYWSPDELEQRLSCKAVWRTGERPDLQPFVEESKAITFGPGEGMPGQVWTGKEPAFIIDVLEDSNFPRAPVAAEVGLHAAICTPLLDRGHCLGVVEFLSAAIGQADQKLIDALRSIGFQVGQQIAVLRERGAMLERLEMMTLTDQLTGILNRRGWDEGLPKELSRAKRDGRPLCVALLDLDGFKSFNDRHGHLAGDRALVEIANGWSTQVRETDLLARYGGEEFALALPALPIDDAVAAMDRLRALVPRGLTCSGGVAEWDGAESAEGLLGRADAALYEAKRAGRDLVTAARA